LVRISTVVNFYRKICEVYKVDSSHQPNFFHMRESDIKLLTIYFRGLRLLSLNILFVLLAQFYTLVFSIFFVLLLVLSSTIHSTNNKVVKIATLLVLVLLCFFWVHIVLLIVMYFCHFTCPIKL
jgi:hypothetical protein